MRIKISYNKTEENATCILNELLVWQGHRKDRKIGRWKGWKNWKINVEMNDENEDKIKKTQIRN